MERPSQRLWASLECLRSFVLGIPPGIVWLLLIWSYYVFNCLYVPNYVISPLIQVRLWNGWRITHSQARAHIRTQLSCWEPH